MVISFTLTPLITVTSVSPAAWSSPWFPDVHILLPLPVATQKLSKSHTELMWKYSFLLKISPFCSSQKLGSVPLLTSHIFLRSLYFSAPLLLLAAPDWYLSCPSSTALKLTSPKFPALPVSPDFTVPTLKLTAPTMYPTAPPLHPTVSLLKLIATPLHP